MSNTDLDPISKALGLEVSVPLEPRPVVKQDEDSPEVEDDYQSARSNLKELIQQMMENIPEVIAVMQQTQSDKMYGAAAGFIKAAGDLNISLSKLSLDVKKRPKTKEAPQAPQTVTQNNTNVYVGTTEGYLQSLEKEAASLNPAIIDAEVVEAGNM
jgi:hypothetical protein